MWQGSQGGSEIAKRLFDECINVARAHHTNPSDSFIQSMSKRLTDRDSTLTASMMRDMERNSKVEADQIIGDLIEKAKEKDVSVPILDITYCALKAYENKSGQASASINTTKAAT